ncbi:ATP-binding protein [Algisphaera agarilytica]|uniref:histidine kinase n=1 Tax=Algisphaera agarilytica TaxID=1385975 RepID=A0A7X0LLT5_9BACT|nr:ATP-binding protein [Algisphaera agarilytica]MBB6430308.1 PAS domain S-box-containing protein [Algisphaera agarilytica]
MSHDADETRQGRSQPPSDSDPGNGSPSFGAGPSTDLMVRLVQASPVPMILSEIESGRVVSANHQMESILGYPAKELTGEISPNLYYNPEDRRAIVKLIREKGAVQDRELWSRRKDGSPVRIILSSQRVLCDGVELLITGFNDLTELTEAQSEVQRHQEELAHVTRLNMLGEMASGLAHELNQPLSAIANYAAGLTKRMENRRPDPELIRDTLGRINEQAQRGGEMIKRLRSMIAKRPTKAETVTLNTLAKNVLDLCNQQLMEHRVVVELHLESEASPVKVDPIQIEQIIMNFIRNAIDAMDETPPAERRIELTTRPAGEKQVAVAVRDHGKRLTQDQLDSVFDPFYTTKEKGMGMGLAISESIAMAHGGGLTAQAHPDRGATFTLTLPVYTPTAS